MSKTEQEISFARRPERLSVLAHAGFVLVGVVNTLLGPMLPTLSMHWQLNDSQAGRLFAAQYFGAMVGASFSGMVSSKYGHLRTLFAGYTGMSIMIACLGVSTRGTSIASVLILGVFMGIAIPITNVLVSEMYPARRAAALNLVNLAWGAGAIAGPPVLVFFSRTSVLPPMICLGLMLGLVATLLYRCKPHEAVMTIPAAAPAGFSALRAWATPYAAITGLLIFVYVGTEASTGGWIGSYAKRLAGSTQTFWAFVQSIFWAGLLGSRALAPAILRIYSARRLIISGMITANAGLAIILLSRNLTGVTIGAAVAGFGLGPVFPTTFALFSHRFETLAARMAGFVFVIASSGAAVFPWVVGLVSNRYGGLRVGFLVPAIGAIVMVLLEVSIVSFRSLDAHGKD